MIATIAEIKEILGITDTSKDTLINSLIPIITETIKNLVNQRFIDKEVNIEYPVSFTSPDTITIANIKFTDYYFLAGMEIEIQNSILNDGIYIIDTVTDYIITTIEQTINTIDFTNKKDIKIYKINYPKSLKTVLAHMINECISSQKIRTGINSFSLGDESISLATTGLFSEGLLKTLYDIVPRKASMK